MRFKINENLFKVTYEGNEGYVITDGGGIVMNDYVYQNNFEKTNPQIIDITTSFQAEIANDKDGNYVKLRITASTFPLGDLPQFVIEEDIQKLAVEEHKYNHRSIKEVDFRLGFEIGWNKHAEKYKFMEEDIKKAITLAREVSGMEAVVKQLQNKYLNREDFQYTEEEIIQSLQKPKEITEIEFETINSLYSFQTDKGVDKLLIGNTSDYPHGFLTIKNIKYV